jgi:hypothetical protein
MAVAAPPLDAMARVLAITGLCIGFVALVLQFAITMQASMLAGRSFAGSVVFYLSFFTILTNIGAALVYSAVLTGKPGRFGSPRMRAGVAVAIAVVMIVYATILARLWQPAGLFLLCDVLLHYVTPVLYLAWWLYAGVDGSTRWRDLPWWLVYPLFYLAWVMIRAPFAGEVPYPFLDTTTNGVGSVAISSLSVLGLFLLVSVVVLAADQIVGTRRRVQSNQSISRQ